MMAYTTYCDMLLSYKNNTVCFRESIVLLKVCIVWKAYIHPIVGVESPLSSLPHISKVRIP
ncbi:hypothetical protein [Bacillus phage CP-51]|uniref:Uncharacterized protein n=1 Tax=Bacillus phage CP-51 TaxID=1391188 RepID=A0A068EQ59_9CAUD|nr:hypothetical protein OZ73_gp002 [Bacillus phage CP-51]AID50437.1 hypothetical protein [Bacillus phage CP-51]